MISEPLYLYLLSALLASIPAIIWLVFLIKDAKHKGLQLMIFFFSIFSVVPVFAIQYILNVFPQFDIVQFLQNQISNQNLNYLILFIAVGIVEEVVKQLILRLIDKKYLLIQTINDSIKYSLVAALAFSFVENIFYILSIYVSLGVKQLIIAYLFRSIFTTTAHLIFSGFFGYYYGIAKFSINIVEQEQITGKKHIFASLIGRILQISKIQAFKELTIIKGLFLAIIMHATFNFLLQLNIILPVAIYIFLGYLLLQYLLKRKTGKLIMISDFSNRLSTMNRKDEDVVIELMGLWFKQKKFVDVLHICQRLLERDPDNKVVQLFKTQALDKLDPKSPYNKILKNIFPPQKKASLTALIKNKPNQIVTSVPQIKMTESGKIVTEKKDDNQGIYNLNV